jgi:hypothetical protein
MLLGEEANEEPPALFVGRGHETIKDAVILGRTAMRMLPTSQASAVMNGTSVVGLGHNSLPPSGAASRVRSL